MVAAEAEATLFPIESFEGAKARLAIAVMLLD
jgi:hypothetical protein